MTKKRAGLRGVILLVAASFSIGCTPQNKSGRGPRDGAEHAAGQAARPPWLKGYSEQQLAVLAMPLENPVQQPAPFVYPNLKRFTFIGEGPLNVPDDLLAYANVVNEALAQSPYLYVFRSGPSELANVEALYGPAPELVPDPWKRVAPDQDRRPSLVPALPSDEVRALLDKVSKATKEESLSMLRDAAARGADVPGVQAMLADAALAAGDFATAEGAAQAALQIDDRYPHAQRTLAEVYLHRGDTTAAARSIAQALALYPTYPRAWKVAEAIVQRPLDRNVAVDVPFVEVNDKGAAIVVTCERPFCEAYGACKAAFRYEPHFRGTILQEPTSEPYHLSATEEVVCIEAGLGAHLAAQESKDKPSMPDPVAEMLVRLAAEKGLSSFAMFEVVGKHRPEWLRVAPQPVHDGVVDYIMNFVLGQGLPPADGAPPSGEPVTAELPSVRVHQGS